MGGVCNWQDEGVRHADDVSSRALAAVALALPTEDDLAGQVLRDAWTSRGLWLHPRSQHGVSLIFPAFPPRRMRQCQCWGCVFPFAGRGRCWGRRGPATLPPRSFSTPTASSSSSSSTPSKRISKAQIRKLSHTELASHDNRTRPRNHLGSLQLTSGDHLFLDADGTFALRSPRSRAS